MAQARQDQKTAPPTTGAAQIPDIPSRETVQSLLGPELAAQTPKALLEALPWRLGCYLDMLCAWNKAINLTGPRERTEILERLIPDSFRLGALLRGAPLAEATGRTGRAGPEIWDLGAGAGLPGIPLRMLWQEGDYTLVEAREKRALFLANALAALDLARTKVFRGPAERLFAARPEGADLILSRAFLPWPRLLGFCEPMLRPGGALVIFAACACGKLPTPWRLLAETSYVVAGNRRWLWALQSSESYAARVESSHA